MPQIQIKTNSGLSSEFNTNGILIPFSFTTYNTELLHSHSLINIYHGIQIGSIDVSPLTPNTVNDIYEKIRVETPNTEIILTEDPYDALGNVMRFLSEKDDSIGRDGDILFTTTDYKFFKRENGVYVFKFQMQGGSGVAVAAQWHFSDIINNNIGVDGDLLLRTDGQIYKKINGVYNYQITISGSPGLPGTNGSNGSKIFISSGSTYNLSSENGDLNIVDSTDLYQKVGGLWSYIGRIKGEKGIKGDIGATLPAQEIRFLPSVDNGIGVDGDIIISSLDYKIYKKILGSYIYQSEFSTPEGTVWHYNQTVNNSIGKDDDFLLIENGNVYKKNSGIYSLQVNIKGQDGISGNSVLFNSTLDNNLGINGDILFVGNNIYKKEANIFVLKQILSSGSSKLKKSENISTSTHNTLLISKTTNLIELITLNVLSQTTISIENAETDKKRVVLYILNNTTGNQQISLDTTNIVFTGLMQGITISLSESTGSKDSICLEYNELDSKWNLISFINNVF